MNKRKLKRVMEGFAKQVKAVIPNEWELTYGTEWADTEEYYPNVPTLTVTVEIGCHSIPIPCALSKPIEQFSGAREIVRETKAFIELLPKAVDTLNKTLPNE